MEDRYNIHVSFTVNSDEDLIKMLSFIVNNSENVLDLKFFNLSPEIVLKAKFDKSDINA